MQLKTLIKNLEITQTLNVDENVDILDICSNSKTCKADSIFVCLSGTNTDGQIYVHEAIKNGAKVVVCECVLDASVPQIVVKNARISLTKLCANFFNNPQNKLKFVSVVGTNGKTSTAHILAHILTHANKKVGIIGTNGIFYGGKKYFNDMTTPDPYMLFKTLQKMRDANVEYVIMEVSAHAIFFNKVYGIKNECTIFTNFSQDHLDFFGTMQNYKQVKLSYLTLQNTKSLVVNIDDKVGKEILQSTNILTLTYGIKNPSDVFAVNISMNLEGSEFVVNNLDNVYSIKTNLTCLFNVYNILSCISACNILGISKKIIQKSLLSLSQIDGRFNLIKSKQNFNIIIDYAHTPKSLQSLLQNIKKLTKSKIITVFGCPGNRDELKRSIMGEIAGQLSDYVIVTTDNPEYENSIRIMRHIENGIKKTNTPYKLVDDRQNAINLALSLASPKSTVLIVGKGSEDYQLINGKHVEYSDYLAVEQYLSMAKKLKLDNKFIY